MEKRKKKGGSTTKKRELEIEGDDRGTYEGTRKFMRAEGKKELEERVEGIQANRCLTLSKKGSTWYVTHVVSPRDYFYEVNEENTVLYLVANEQESRALENSFADKQHFTLIERLDKRPHERQDYYHSITGWAKALRRFDSEKQIQDQEGKTLVYRSFYRHLLLQNQNSKSRGGRRRRRRRGGGGGGVGARESTLCTVGAGGGVNNNVLRPPSRPTGVRGNPGVGAGVDFCCFLRGLDLEVWQVSITLVNPVHWPD